MKALSLCSRIKSLSTCGITGAFFCKSIFREFPQGTDQKKKRRKNIQKNEDYFAKLIEETVY